MSFLYAKDLKKRMSSNVLGTPFLLPKTEIDNLDDIKKNIEDRIKFGFELFSVDDENNMFVKKSLDELIARAKLKQSFDTYKPSLSYPLPAPEPDIKSSNILDLILKKHNNKGKNEGKNEDKNERIKNDADIQSMENENQKNKNLTYDEVELLERNIVSILSNDSMNEKQKKTELVIMVNNYDKNKQDTIKTFIYNRFGIIIDIISEKEKQESQIVDLKQNPTIIQFGDDDEMPPAYIPPRILTLDEVFTIINNDVMLTLKKEDIKKLIYDNKIDITLPKFSGNKSDEVYRDDIIKILGDKLRQTQRQEQIAKNKEQTEKNKEKKATNKERKKIEDELKERKKIEAEFKERKKIEAELIATNKEKKKLEAELKERKKTGAELTEELNAENTPNFKKNRKGKGNGNIMSIITSIKEKYDKKKFTKGTKKSKKGGALIQL